MGYYTYYTGDGFTITPPLTKPEFQRAIQLFEFWNSDEEIKKARVDVFCEGPAPLTVADKVYVQEPKPSIDFDLEPDRIAMPDDMVKNYDGQTTLPLVARWLQENGHTLTGEAYWTGDDEQDRGTIYAAVIDGANKVEAVPDVIINIGPSWKQVKETAKP